MKTNEKMEILSAEELEKVLGGYDEVGCKRVQLEANRNEVNWDEWVGDFYRHCV